MDNNYPKAYACYNKDIQVRMKSTSGGVFSLIAQYIIQNMNGVVFGAAFDDNFNVIHSKAENIDEIGKLRGSKYPQSSINDAFAQTKELLERERTVLFVGTPCQIHGLKMFLGKEYENLYCMDFICHGVASPKVWRAYIDILKRNGEIEDIIFKNKKKGWKKWYFKVIYKTHEYSVRGSMNMFMRSYSYCNIRPSCYRCAFKGLSRISDFTISDCWGIGESNMKLNDDKGLSALLIQSEKAQKIFNEISKDLCFEEYKPEVLMEGNPTAIKSVPVHKDREAFFKAVKNNGGEAALIKYFKPTLLSWGKYYVKRLLGREK